MYATDWKLARGHHDLVICPACGASDYNDCHLDLHLHRELEREADGLVHEGRIEEAVDLLSELYARYIANFVSPHWRCLSCGVKFDG
jgi:hypothetical protein